MRMPRNFIIGVVGWVDKPGISAKAPTQPTRVVKSEKQLPKPGKDKFVRSEFGQL